MQNQHIYTQAHLFVAAIRIFEHQHAVPPSVEDVCEMLSVSPEKGHHICRELQRLEIIDVAESAFGIKLYIKNHLAIEDISREEKESRLDEELKKFQSSKKEIYHKIESIQAQQAEKKKNLFAELEKNLKAGLEKK